MPWKDKTKNRTKAREWHQRHPLHARTYKLSKRGWTLEAYLSTMREQKGACAICGEEPQPTSGCSNGMLCGDHAHENPPRPRGLLCHACNMGLGKFKDSIPLLEAAISYLKKWHS